MGPTVERPVDLDLVLIETELKSKRASIAFEETLERFGFSVALAFIIAPPILYYFKLITPEVFTALSVISIISFVYGISSRAAKRRLEAAAEEIEFEIDLLKYPVQKWEIRAEKTLLQNDKRLRRYYDQNLGENNKLFYVGILCVVLGVAVLGVTLYVVYTLREASMDSKIIVAALGGVGSLLTNYVAAIYLKVHAAASRNLGTFHGRLVDTHQVLLANMIASRIDDNNKRWDTFSSVAENIIVKNEAQRPGKEDKDENSGGLEAMAKIIEKLAKLENGAVDEKKDE
jgi:hypothetical protein